MKKIFLNILVFFLIFSAHAKNWFSERYFEFGVEVPFGISNNALQIGDILKKEVEIDFKKLADRTPESGMNFNAMLSPSFSIKLNLKNVQIGVKTGVESWMDATFSKDLIEYIGNGNELYESVSVSQDLNLDLFSFQEVSVGFKAKDFKITLKPALFAPVMHVSSSDGKLTLENLRDGTMKVNYKSDIDIYSAFDLEDGSGIKPGIGFDFGASVSYPVKDYLILTGNARIPLVPGSLNYKTVQSTTMNFETSIDKIMDGGLGEGDFDTDRSDSVSKKHYINRPMKFSLFADFMPFDSWVTLTGGLGLGFRHPFTSDRDSFAFFGEYYLGGSMTFFRAFTMTASTQYYEQVFIHELFFALNLRVFELDFAVSAQSTDFTRSCAGSGIGGLVAVKFGY